jgi:putative ABC transport system ATP-binding protein
MSNEGEMALIALKNLEKSVGGPLGRTWLLRRIDLEIQKGDFVTIMGPSGAGKSTLLQILGLLDGDFQGEYFLDGQAVHQLSNTKRQELGRQKIGFVFQHFHLLDDLTVAENLEIPLSYRDLKRAERQAKVADILDLFQIVGKKDLYPGQLSGGQQQLVGIARALIIEPEILLADEPTGNLHSAQGREVMECFRALNQEGKTIIQVTHSEENAGYGQRIVRLRDGWLEP